MKKIFEKMERNSLFICMLLAAMSMMAIYISQASSNVPIMDYWRYFDALIEKAYTGGVTFQDLYSNNGVHRTPGQLFLFLCNVKLFHWNTQISMYIGVLILAIYSTIFYVNLKKSVTHKTILSISSLFILMISFSLGAFEIITQEFFTSFAIRILLFVLGFIICDIVLNENERNVSGKAVLFISYNVFTICIWGAAYAMAYAMAIVFVILGQMIFEVKYRNRVYFINCAIVLLGIAIAIFLYLRGLELSVNNIEGNIWSIICSYFQGFVIVNAASLFGSEISGDSIFLIGMLVITIHIYFVFVYFKRRIYKKNRFPIYVYMYSLIFYSMIFMARRGFGIEYLASSRYIIDSSMAFIADIYVLAMLFDGERKITVVEQILAVFSIVSIGIGVLYVNQHELDMQKYRKIYNENLIEMMINIDNYKDEELDSFQAGNSDLVRKGVKIMKKYDLGVFYRIEDEGF